MLSLLQWQKQKIRHTNYCCFRYTRSNQNDFPIPGNDARRSINLYCELLKNTIKDTEKLSKDLIKNMKKKLLKKKKINLNYSNVE